MQISTLERGGQSMSIEWMRRLAKALDVAPGSLLLLVDNAAAAHDPAEAHILELARSMPAAFREQFIAIGEAMAGSHAPPAAEDSEAA